MNIDDLKSELKKDFGPILRNIHLKNKSVKNFLIIWTAIHILIFAFSFNSKSRLHSEESKATIEHIFYPTLTTYSVDADGYLIDDLPGKAFVLETYDFTELLLYVGSVWLVIYFIDSNKNKK